jgi:hypothetical protein
MKRLSEKPGLRKYNSMRSLFTQPLSSLVKQTEEQPPEYQLSTEKNPWFSPHTPDNTSPRVARLARLPTAAAEDVLSASKPEMLCVKEPPAAPSFPIEWRAHDEIHARARERALKIFYPRSNDDSVSFNWCMSCQVVTRCVAHASLMVFPEEDYIGCMYVACSDCTRNVEISRVKELVDYMAIPLRATQLDCVVLKTRDGYAHVFNIRWVEPDQEYVVDLKSQHEMFMQSLGELKELNPRLVESLRKIVYWPDDYPMCMKEHFSTEVKRCCGGNL